MLFRSQSLGLGRHPQHKLGAAPTTGLGQQGGDMAFHGPHTEVEGRGDLTVAGATSQDREHPLFGRTEIRHRTSIAGGQGRGIAAGEWFPAAVTGMAGSPEWTGFLGGVLLMGWVANLVVTSSWFHRALRRRGRCHLCGQAVLFVANRWSCTGCLDRGTGSADRQIGDQGGDTVAGFEAHIAT
mgnify:CR=1 FL=1